MDRNKGLRRSVYILENNCWSPDAWEARDPSGVRVSALAFNAYEFCVRGAVLRAATNTGTLYNAMMDAINQVLQKEEAGLRLEQWENVPGRTMDGCIALLGRAAMT